MTTPRTQLANTRRWIIKIGSALITKNGTGLNEDAIRGWADQIAHLKESGKEIVLVSSGAVAEGMTRLGWSKRPHALYELQAAAAVGQMGLVQAYETHFQNHNLHSAQILLTHEDLRDRKRYLNARSTLCRLLNLGVIPVVNENDTVATEEIRFGDNDNLAALVANLIEAELLVILTDQEGIFEANPRTHRNAKLISEAHVDDLILNQAAGPSSSTLGRGGMITKISAARRAARSGTATIIAAGKHANILQQLATGESLGTLLQPNKEPLAARKRWIANQLRASGKLHLDTGAARVIQQSGRSLLAVGVTQIDGRFMRGDMVSCVNTNGQEIARGLINYDAAETLQIKGRSSAEIESLLGYVDEPELIHRDNLVLMSSKIQT